MAEIQSTNLPVGTAYEVAISHPDPIQRGPMTFAIDWVCRGMVLGFEDLEVVHGTLDTISVYVIELVVGVTEQFSDRMQCRTYWSTYTFGVVGNNETLILDDADTHPACDICGSSSSDAATTLVLHPDYAMDRLCSDWQKDGLDGRLTPDACEFLVEHPLLAENCGCRFNNTSPTPSAATQVPASLGVRLALVLFGLMFATRP
jgi:hypothetical protein